MNFGGIRQAKLLRIITQRFPPMVKHKITNFGILNCRYFCNEGLSPPKKKNSISFSVDRSGLIEPDVIKPIDVEGSSRKEKSSKLTSELKSYIDLRGPITVHDFMAQAGNHFIHGYYQNKSDKIGKEGDFITAPEISQLFGEMIGVWAMSVWQALDKPPKLKLIELGPGNGTLMKDVLRVLSKFKQLNGALEVHMVEMSETMRMKQREQLQCVLPESNMKNQEGLQTAVTPQGIRVAWYNFLTQVPNCTIPEIIIGQEFLDAFPVHQFVYTKAGWREKLIDVDNSPQSEFHFRPVLAKKVTPAVKTLIQGNRSLDITSTMKRDPLLLRKQQGVAVAASRLVDSSPTSASRSKEISSTSNSNSNSNTNSSASEATQSTNTLDTAKSSADSCDATSPAAGLMEGDGIEISPLALATCEDIARRLSNARGSSLLIDYGETFTQSDTLRAFKKHKQVSFLSEPGDVDITADVDFAMCAKTAQAAAARATSALGVKSTITTKTVTQGEFLVGMGVVDRVEKLIERPETSEEQAEEIIAGLMKLIGGESNNAGADSGDIDTSGANSSDISSDSCGGGRLSGGMGQRFKCMAISSLEEIPGFSNR